MLPRRIDGPTAMIPSFLTPTRRTDGLARGDRKITREFWQLGEVRIRSAQPAHRGMTMNRIPVESSTVADLGYEEATLTLEVGFLNGTIYQYFDVPETVYQEFMQASSKGTFLNANIKNSYRYVKL